MPTETGKLYNGEEAAVLVEFENHNQVEFLIDTGFSGFLCLPRSVLTELDLKISGTTDIEGIGLHSETLYVCVTNIFWLDEKLNDIEIIVNEGEDFLLGTKLLENTELYINYKTGEVLINS